METLWMKKKKDSRIYSFNSKIKKKKKKKVEKKGKVNL